MVGEAVKQTVLGIFWLVAAGIFQYSDPSTMPTHYAIGGMIGVGLLITFIWIISPLLAGRMYRERIAELERRLKALEEKNEAIVEQNQKLAEQNTILREANEQYERDMKNALRHIRQLSAEINKIKARYGEVTDC